MSYPAGWHVNEGDVLPACSAFASEPFEVPEAQEFFDVGVLLSVEPVDFSTVAAPDARSQEVLDRTTTMVEGHDAVRIETRASGEALLPEGTRSTRWIVVAGAQKTLVAVTYGVEGQDYEANREVLDEMVERLEMPLEQ